MLTKKIDNDKIHKLKAIIEEGDDFVIVAHELPDGDAIGASLALYHYLNTFDKKSITVIVPNEYPSFLKWLPGANEIIEFNKFKDFSAQLIGKADVIFCLDFNGIKRVGRMDSTLAAADAKKVMIDHHPEPENFCDLTISHPEMSSTSELIFRVICSLGAFEQLDIETAECIYTGMMTDTGAFSYNSNDAEIYLIISELIKVGIDKDEIYRKVYSGYSEHRMRLMGYVLYEKMKRYKDKKTAMFALTQEELNHFHYRSGDTEGFVNLLLNMEGILFSAFLREETNLIKISLRSSGDFPCNTFAAKYFNGGGHKNASGGEYHGKLEDAIKVFEEGLLNFNPNNY
ncbi:MAG: bifunctional oligoribonuclease/PAP phosphatase NrnA [Tannerella sp.]|jgi:phosphoesterase RecJ-like protein|nr:bifunctional oligoribonuclease/PAP phosphatase NrnA [Tannerella sp.]